MSNVINLPSLSRRAALLGALEARRDQLLELLAGLVRQPTVLGAEETGQTLVAEWLGNLGFTVERIVPDAREALADPYAGYPMRAYAGRSSVAARLVGSGGGRSLHLSGHIDVVPVDPSDKWLHDPWQAVVAGGRLWGRGAGDMKGGLAAYLMAAAAIADIVDDLRGDLVFSSVIEEECGGNGMWSVLASGYGCDATLIGEPTGMQFAHASTGVVWARLSARGSSGHSSDGGRSGLFEELAYAISSLRRLEAELNDNVQKSVFASASDWPYGLTVGQIGGGVWPSSAPAELTARVRFGFGLDHEPSQIQDRIRAAVEESSPGVLVTFEAFRARAWCGSESGQLPELLRSAHGAITGSDTHPMAFTATTDARYVEGPCLCYGPIAGNFHGKDEWVDVESVTQTAAVVALLGASWLA